MPHGHEGDAPDERDALDDLERITLAIALRSEWEQDNRRGLLWVHSIMGMTGGLQILLFGGPGNVERAAGVWTRPALGVLALIGGILLAVGLARRPRRIALEAAGLLVVGLWDSCMALGQLGARLAQGEFDVRPILQPQPLGYVVSYPISVYGGLLALICIHLWTLGRLARR